MRNTNIVSGFDFEILLGAEYFLFIAQTAWDYQEIPHQVQLGDELTDVGRPTATQILAGDEADLELTTSLGPLPVNLRFRFEVEDGKVQLRFVAFDEWLEVLIVAANGGANNGGDEALASVIETVRAAVEQEIPLNLGDSFTQPALAKLVGNAEYASAIGLYLNNNRWLVSAQENIPTWSPGPRGNVAVARSFLRHGEVFAVGLAQQTFTRIANHAWHSTARSIDGDVKHPIDEPETLAAWKAEVTAWEAADPSTRGDRPQRPAPIGEFRSFSLAAMPDLIRLTILSRIFIDWWPDADVMAQFDITPELDAGELVLDPELTAFDADTGLLGDFLGFLVGAISGGLLFGPIGAIVGGASGITAVEITEGLQEGAQQGNVAEQGEQMIGQQLDMPALHYDILRRRIDPFYVTHVRAVHSFTAVEVDFFGMSLVGQLQSEEVYRPVPVRLIDKIRMGPSGGVVQLIYEVPDFPGGERLALMIFDAFDRVRNGRLAEVKLTPTAVHLEELPHIHTEATVVRDVRFSTGLDLRSGEMVQLFRGKIFVMPGYEFIEPRRPGIFGTVARPYFRDIADKDLTDNLKNLPPFTPQ